MKFKKEDEAPVLDHHTFIYLNKQIG